MPNDLLADLQQTVSGLLYPSESDEPFDVINWKAEASGSAREQIEAHIPQGGKIEEVYLDNFFDQLKDSDEAARFQQLRQTLELRLRDVKAFRVLGGSARVDIYLLGTTPGGEWAGVHTVSVET